MALKNSSPFYRWSFKLSDSGRAQIAIGALAICMGWMEYMEPSPWVSARWGWLRRLAIQVVGEQEYAVLLVLIGLLFIAWAVTGPAC